MKTRRPSIAAAAGFSNVASIQEWMEHSIGTVQSLNADFVSGSEHTLTFFFFHKYEQRHICNMNIKWVGRSQPYITYQCNHTAYISAYAELYIS